jgi:HEAT repeat protein
MMKRRFHFFALIVLACLLPGVLGAKLIKGPYLQWLTTDGVTVMWETDEAAPATVEYGPEGQWTGRLEVKQGKPLQEVRLNGLKAETTYQYRVVIGQETAGPFAFRTAVKPGSAYRFAVYGDNRSNPKVHTSVVEGMAKFRPAFVINTGDLVSSGDKYELWGPEYFGPLANLQCSVPVYPAMGNHEGKGKYYQEFFSLPAPKWYYSFTFGNARFIILDSNYRSAGWLSPESEQSRWLVKQLRDNKSTWTFVVFHNPPYSSHPSRGDSVVHQKMLCPILEKYHVDVVFNGHNHNYERVYPIREMRRDDENGIPYVITGGGGAPLYPVAGDWFTATCESIHNYCIADVDGPVFGMVAYEVGGRVIDRLSLCKDVDYLARLADQARSASGAARAGMVERLSYFFSPKMPGILEGFAGDADVAVRRHVADGLGRLAMPAARAVALKLIGDSDAEVRRGAALAIGRTSTEEQTEPIRRLLADADAGVRRNAAWFFALNSGPRTVVLVLTAMNDSDAAVRRRAIHGLRNVHDASLVPVLAKAVGDEDGGVALTAINQAIRDKRTPELAEGLAKASRHKDSDVRMAAVKALASCGQPRLAIPALIERLSDPNLRIQGAAAGALEGMAGKRFGYDRQKWQKWWDEQPH